MISQVYQEVELRHPDLKPELHPVSDKELQAIKKFLQHAAGAPAGADFNQVQHLLERNLSAIPVDIFNLAQSGYRAADMLSICGINENGNVYLLNLGYDNCRRMSVEAMQGIIDNVWGCGRDDLILLNEKLSWAVLVHHSGSLHFTRLS